MGVQGASRPKTAVSAPPPAQSFEWTHRIAEETGVLNDNGVADAQQR
jgi:hypothetical protein